MTSWVVAAAVIWIVMALVSSRLARLRSRSEYVFFALGLLFPLITLVVVAVLQPVQFQSGSIVRLTTKVRLKSGGTLPRGLKAQVRKVSIRNNKKVVSIADKSGKLWWVPATAVRLTS